MTVVYDYNPIELFYTFLKNEIGNKMNGVFEKYEAIDPIIDKILCNNGCKKSDAGTLCCNQYITENYCMYFITGMIGNEVNEYYDYIVINGMRCFIIFLDYFNIYAASNLMKLPEEDDISYKLRVEMGNSVYYDAIKNLVEVFYDTFEQSSTGSIHTAAANAQRWNKIIVAIHILKEYKPVDDVDVTDIPISDIRKISNGNIKYLLYGIRYSE